MRIIKDIKTTKNTSTTSKTKPCLNIKLINIQGLTKVKLIQLLNILDTNTILCTTETHKKYDGLQIPKDVKFIHKHRKTRREDDYQ